MNVDSIGNECKARFEIESECEGLKSKTTQAVNYLRRQVNLSLYPQSDMHLLFYTAGTHLTKGGMKTTSPSANRSLSLVHYSLLTSSRAFPSTLWLHLPTSQLALSIHPVPSQPVQAPVPTAKYDHAVSVEIAWQQGCYGGVDPPQHQRGLMNRIVASFDASCLFAKHNQVGSV
ncbi:hypothetical protein CISG_01455 [Coccidioides immitis RMSCC 3703]|uniref:Uncharacterized protein n=1 Tax=Coccidioides immitis RMSCC 3703 TaxID=454286 RepID=A0A0J8R205_COCIT|nr:hypothetical protein CISG_01455 [Coccidioides immitis RMSCC 3703]